MSRRWLWAFAILGLLNAALFLTGMWRDYDREWKRYQKTFFGLEGRKARTAREEAAVRGRRHELVQITVAGSNRMDRCTTCHMPKYELPGGHFKFTDHDIRIVRLNAPFPG